MSHASASPVPDADTARTLVLRAVALDFDRKVEEVVPAEGVSAALASGRFVWIDAEWSDAAAARTGLSALRLVGGDVLDDALGREPATQIARFDGYIHMALASCRLAGESLALDRVDAVLGERFLLTIHRGPVPLIDAVRRHPISFAQ